MDCHLMVPVRICARKTEIESERIERPTTAYNTTHCCKPDYNLLLYCTVLFCTLTHKTPQCAPKRLRLQFPLTCADASPVLYRTVI